jgi:hypothetical protein
MLRCCIHLFIKKHGPCELEGDTATRTPLGTQIRKLSPYSPLSKEALSKILRERGITSPPKASMDELLQKVCADDIANNTNALGAWYEHDAHRQTLTAECFETLLLSCQEARFADTAAFITTWAFADYDVAQGVEAIACLTLRVEWLKTLGKGPTSTKRKLADTRKKLNAFLKLGLGLKNDGDLTLELTDLMSQMNLMMPQHATSDALKAYHPSTANKLEARTPTKASRPKSKSKGKSKSEIPPPPAVSPAHAAVAEELTSGIRAHTDTQIHTRSSTSNLAHTQTLTNQRGLCCVWCSEKPCAPSTPSS